MIVGQQDVMDILFKGNIHGVTYIRANCYRLWTKDEEEGWWGELGNRDDVVAFSNKHGLSVWDTKLDPFGEG